jgi:hypothetical protein
MAEILAGTGEWTLTPPGGAPVIARTLTIQAEQVKESLRRTLTVPAGQTDFPVPLPNFTTVTFLAFASDKPFTYKKGLTTNNPNTCRKIALETPNAEAIPSLFISTGTAPVTIDIVAAGN